MSPDPDAWRAYLEDQAAAEDTARRSPLVWPWRWALVAAAALWLALALALAALPT